MSQTVQHSAGADAVVQTAILMEETGRDFYLALAAAITGPELIALCRKLAAEESDHRESFRRIRSELARQGQTVLLGDEQLADARRSVRASVLPDSETMRRSIAAGRLDDLLSMAIQMEASAVSYYSGLARDLPDPRPVEQIIRQEQGHLRMLKAVRQG